MTGAAANCIAADASGVWIGFLRSELAYGARSPDANYPFTRTDAGVTKARTSLSLEYERWFGEDWKLRLSGSAFYDSYYAAKGRDRFP